MGESFQTLDELAAHIGDCHRCSLGDTRNTLVFGVGDPDASVLFVGEAPGRNEDLEGEPFVGAAGKLLDRLLSEIGIDRADVYIANVLKCRPPGNRDPRPGEIDCCKGYLRTQIELIDPKVVMTLGNFATKLLLKRDVGITRLRGQVYPWWRRHLVPTFHPAAALRGGDRVANQMREDFALVSGLLNAPPETPAVDAPDETVEQLGLFG